jgi:hypothetical protein
MRRIIAALGLVWPLAAAAQDWQVLGGPEIGAALSARVLQYEDGTTQNFFSDGRTLFEAGAGESWGKWWATETQYCSTWPPNETPSCYDVEASGLDIRFTGSRGDVTTGRYVDLN